MLATLAHQSRSRQLLLPCFFAKQIPTMLHEHFDDTLLFSRVEIFCSKRGQNWDCRDWKSDLQNPAVEKGVMWHVSIAPACDVHQFFAPSSTLDGFDISSVIRHQLLRPSSRGCWRPAEAVWSRHWPLLYSREAQLLFVPCSLFRRLNIVKADEGGGLWPPRPPRPTAISGCKLTAHSSEPKGYEHVRLAE